MESQTENWIKERGFATAENTAVSSELWTGSVPLCLSCCLGVQQAPIAGQALMGRRLISLGSGWLLADTAPGPGHVPLDTQRSSSCQREPSTHIIQTFKILK